MTEQRRTVAFINAWLFLAGLFLAALPAIAGTVTGQVTDPQGKSVGSATVRLQADGESIRISDEDGQFTFANVAAGSWRLVVSASGFKDVTENVSVARDGASTVNPHFGLVAAHNDTVTVTADVIGQDIERPDPGQRVLVRDEILDANPGRPGAPVSIPGVPIESASGGIKAPQYFAPGVAGDHGEPIAQFIGVGRYLMPNNLSANAHGNGYSDPNIMIPAIIESVTTDGGAFNVREGNHSVDLAATYAIRPTLAPFATLTADYRDLDLSAGWKWIGVQASYGNGFLDAPEHRRQYKVNALKSWDRGAHHLTVLFIGYYGQSKIPGLAPVNLPGHDTALHDTGLHDTGLHDTGLHDTIDSRQRDQTHTGILALNDVWRLSQSGELHVSGFFRTYNLSLLSNFGDGLIRQSEFRTVTGENLTYLHRFNSRLSFMTGVDYLREAPRREDLDHYGSTNTAIYGPFQKVTANDITLNFVTPFAAIDGSLLSWLHYNLGWRRDEIGFSNVDLLTPGNSFARWIGINSPKATLTIAPSHKPGLPTVSFSFGQTFFSNDPRIGTGVGQGSLVSQAHAYQVVVSKTVLKTDVRVTLGHVTQAGSLAKIDADTGLQFDEGPSLNRYITVSARHYFGIGMLQASVSKADARDLSDGTPLAEAPRLIMDVLGTIDRLPFHLQTRGEFEEVGAKPLGDGFVSVPVREFRGAVVRSFDHGKVQAGVHFQIASGYTGQTTEYLALPGEAEATNRVVGVFIPSYVTVSGTYRFGH